MRNLEVDTIIWYPEDLPDTVRKLALPHVRENVDETESEGGSDSSAELYAGDSAAEEQQEAAQLTLHEFVDAFVEEVTPE